MNTPVNRPTLNHQKITHGKPSSNPMDQPLSLAEAKRLGIPTPGVLIISPHPKKGLKTSHDG